MRKLLGLLILLAPLCAHAQFAKIQGGPLVGNCNPHTLGMDFVNNNIYECDGEPVPQWKLVGGINNQGIIPVLLRTNSPNCTTTNQLVQYDPGQVDSAGIGEVTNAAISSTGVIGVVISGAGCSGIATIATYLSAQCITDNQSTVGDLVSPSTTVPGQCHDYGSSLATGVQTVGRVSKANTGQGTASQVDFFLGNQLSPGSSGGNGTVTNCGTAGGIAYYVTAGNVVGCDPNFTTDGSGNWTSHSGTVNDTSHAGYLNVIQGATPPTAPTNGVQLTVPTSITGYSLYLPGTKPTSGDCANWSAISGQIQITDSGSPCGGSGGGVSTFSSGNLSPLFTTSVATPTSTPALSFTLSNANGNTFYSNVSNSPGVPSFNSIPSCANDGAHALVYVSGTGLVCESIVSGLPTTQIANPTAPTLTNQNAAGARSITYKVVALERDDAVYTSAASSSATIANANASPQVLLSAYGDTLYGARCFDVYVTADSGGRTLGKIAHCVGKEFIDIGTAGDTTTAPSTNNSALTINMAHLPGCNIPVSGLIGVDAPPCSPTAFDDEMDQTFGAPGDSQDPFWTWGGGGTSPCIQNSATASWSGGAIILTTDSTAQFECLTLTLPSTPYTFKVWVSALAGANSASHSQCGVGFRESSTGKMWVMSILPNQIFSNTTYNGGFILGSDNWSSNAAESLHKYLEIAPNDGYLTVQNTGSNLVGNYSDTGNGMGFFSANFDTQTVGNAFTTAPNQLVIGGAALGGQPVTCTFDFERRTQ